MRLLGAAIAILLATPAWAASEPYCVQWAIKAKVNATKMLDVDRAFAWCQLQDLDPPLVDGRVDTGTGPRVDTASHYPGCHHFRSYDPKTKSFLDYSHKRRPCL